MIGTATHVILRRRPTGNASADDFEVVAVPIPEPAEGEILIRTSFLSLDPYMRGRMSDGPSYASPVPIGSPMVGAIVGDVIASRAPSIAVGTVVTTGGGWRSHVAVAAHAVRVVDPAVAPVSTALGVLGMPGQTAWYGLNRIGHPKAGETVVVAAATGAVGSVVGQLARIAGCRVVGIAGSDEKCAHAVRDLGFDTCLNHRTHDVTGLRDALRKACPRGIDVYFENVGGAVLAAVLPNLNTGARIPLCGLISRYNGEDQTPLNLGPLLANRVTLQGFIISDHPEAFPPFIAEVAPLVQSGQVRYREDIVDGLENAPTAFLRLFRGENFGKLIVRVA
jgi:NADPH-dependent curcumin reductase CurA